MTLKLIDFYPLTFQEMAFSDSTEYMDWKKCKISKKNLLKGF